MTTDLEKQFFDMFGIEQIEGLDWECYSPDHCFKTTCACPENCAKCEYFGKEIVYPEITDRHYLELISELSGVTKPHFVFERGVEELKQDILKQCIFYNKELDSQVRTLFEEG